jgi:CMP-2-keto-3-deoxyoctulosonic acid synthetase
MEADGNIVPSQMKCECPLKASSGLRYFSRLEIPFSTFEKDIQFSVKTERHIGLVTYKDIALDIRELMQLVITGYHFLEETYEQQFRPLLTFSTSAYNITTLRLSKSRISS